MWADGAHWLPEILDGKVIQARFVFNADNETLAEVEMQPEKDFLWLHLRDLPYFRSMLRAVEAGYYQDFWLEHPILDIGSGDGHFAEIAFGQPLDVGLDPWRDPNAHAAQYGGHKTLVQAYGDAQPFPDGAFASIISNSVLEHIDGIDAVLVDAARTLRPGGWLLFCVPNQRYLTELGIAKALDKLGLKRLAAAYREWFRRMSLVYHADPPEVWQERLENAGFELVDWWHYFSPKSMRALEIGHFFGVPSLVAQKLFGRWIITPARWNQFLTERYVRRFTSPKRIDDGTFSFFVGRKR
jgi:SAM-dependent methyltransferase